jgi:hypothetical protein
MPLVGPAIPAGRLHILVALDPWEALRHMRLAHRGTVCYVETEVMPFFTDRTGSGERGLPDIGPLDQLMKLPIAITWRQYRQQATEHDGRAQMANYYAGLDCINALDMGADSIYRRIFSESIPTSQRIVP